MSQTADLDAALKFVTRRVNEQAAVAGEPLNEQQRLLLAHPLSSSSWSAGGPCAPLVPRNVDYERLCALAKAAYLNDRERNPESREWEFAFAVFELNRHPTWGLLNSAGVTYRRPLSDQLLVIIAALVLPIGLGLGVWGQSRTPLFLAGTLCVTVAIMLGIYFASRKIEHWQLENHIERCRLAARNVG